MLSKRLVSSLSASERSALCSLWVYSGRCHRCFHASFRQNAQDGPEETKAPKMPLNAPKRGPTRQQKAAMVSEEVQMLQRDRPSPSFTSARSDNSKPPPSATPTVDPQAAGANTTPNTMGDNDRSTTEGPYAQGIKVEARTDVDTRVDSRAARSTGQPITEEAASESADDGLEQAFGYSSGARLQRSDASQTSATYLSANPSSADTMIPESRGATVATSDFAALVDDRLNYVMTGSASAEEDRDPNILAQCIQRREFVQFASKEERAAVLEILKRNAQKSIDSSDEGDAARKPAKVPTVATLPDSVKSVLIDNTVAGKYDNEDLLAGQEKYKQPVLNEIARTLTLNGTYLRQDGDRLLAKVRSLLPATTPQARPNAQKAA